MKAIYAELLLDALRKTVDHMDEAGDSYIDVAAGIHIAMRAVEAQDDVWRRVSDAGYPRESGTYICRYRIKGSEKEYFGRFECLVYEETPHFQNKPSAGGIVVTHWSKAPELEDET